VQNPQRCRIIISFWRGLIFWWLMGLANCENNLLCLAKFVVVVFIGPTLCILALTQLIITRRMEKSTGILKKIIHRITFIGSILFTTGWIMEVFVDEDPYPPLLTGLTSVMIDLSSLVMTLLLIIVAYVMTRRLYKSHSVPFPLVSMVVFWVYVVWLIICCIIATILATILDQYWPKYLFVTQLFLGTIVGMVLLWYRFFTFLRYMKVAAAGMTVRMAPKTRPLLPSSESEADVMPTTEYKPSKHLKKFRTYLILKTLFLICGVTLLSILSLLYPPTAQSFRKEMTDPAVYPTDLIFVVFQSISIIQAMWFGWVYCNQISGSIKIPESVNSSSSYYSRTNYS